MEIKTSKVYYIKLGRGGKWEHESIKENQTLKFGYNKISHDLCLRGEWDEVREDLRKRKDNEGAITRDINQVKIFYKADENVLWITFHANFMWWCFSKPEITSIDKNKKIRPVIDKWKCTDVNGNELRTDRLRGSLVSIQGFRGTICSVKDAKYVINKINGKTPPHVEEAHKALRDLVDRLEKVIKYLNPKDFEILIDLIFRQAGWQRVSNLGGSQKTIDLDLISPITQKRYAIQVKSQADLATFENYKNQFRDMQGYYQIYFAVHSPSQDLKNYSETEESETFKVELLLPHRIAELALKLGLANWVLDKF